MRRVVTIAMSICIVGVTIQLGAGAQRQSSGQSGNTTRFIGTWRLVSIESSTPNPNRGPRPRGLIYYDATGHMAVQIIPDRERTSWTGAPTPEQAKEAITGG